MLYIDFLRLQSTIYIYITMTSDITKLEVLIAQEEWSEELGKKIKYEEKLWKEAEHCKLILQRQILEERLDALKRDNMLKEEKLLDMRTCKECMLGEVHELEQEFAARVSYLVLHGSFSYIFWCIFWYIIYLQVVVCIAISYLYIYIFQFCVMYFFMFLIEEDQSMSFY